MRTLRTATPARGVLAKTGAREEKPGKGISGLGSKGGAGQDVPRGGRGGGERDGDGAIRLHGTQYALYYSVLSVRAVYSVSLLCSSVPKPRQDINWLFFALADGVVHSRTERGTGWYQSRPALRVGWAKSLGSTDDRVTLAMGTASGAEAGRCRSIGRRCSRPTRRGVEADEGEDDERE